MSCMPCKCKKNKNILHTNPRVLNVMLFMRNCEDRARARKFKMCEHPKYLAANINLRVIEFNLQENDTLSICLNMPSISFPMIYSKCNFTQESMRNCALQIVISVVRVFKRNFRTHIQALIFLFRPVLPKWKIRAFFRTFSIFSKTRPRKEWKKIQCILLLITNECRPLLWEEE